MVERLEFYTPVVGRFVNGSINEPRTKDSDGRPIPEAEQRYEFGVAFEKAALWPMLAEQWYPWLSGQLARDQNAMSRMTNWFSTMSGFSMKVVDGDKPNQKGQVNEHTVGHFVMYFSSLSVPKTVGPDPAFTEIDAATIKRGFYVQVAGNIAPNEQPGDRAGVYVNCSVVRLIAEGDEIRGGVDAATAFGGAAAPTALPPGARPLGSTSGVSQSFGAPAPVQTAPAGMPGMPGMPAAAPTTVSPGSPPNVVPHTGILAGPPGMPGAR